MKSYDSWSESRASGRVIQPACLSTRVRWGRIVGACVVVLAGVERRCEGRLPLREDGDLRRASAQRASPAIAHDEPLRTTASRDAVRDLDVEVGEQLMRTWIRTRTWPARVGRAKLLVGRESRLSYAQKTSREWRTPPALQPEHTRPTAEAQASHALDAHASGRRVRDTSYSRGSKPRMFCVGRTCLLLASLPLEVARCRWQHRRLLRCLAAAEEGGRLNAGTPPERIPLVSLILCRLLALDARRSDAPGRKSFWAPFRARRRCRNTILGRGCSSRSRRGRSPSGRGGTATTMREGYVVGFACPATESVLGSVPAR